MVAYLEAGEIVYSGTGSDIIKQDNMWTSLGYGSEDYIGVNPQVIQTFNAFSSPTFGQIAYQGYVPIVFSYHPEETINFVYVQWSD